MEQISENETYETRAPHYTRLIDRNKSLAGSNGVYDAIVAVETFFGTAVKRSAFERIEREKKNG